MWPAADLPTATKEILGGRLSLLQYVQGFRRPLDLATLCRDDPLPGLLELPLQARLSLRKRLRSSRCNGAASPQAEP